MPLKFEPKEPPYPYHLYKKQLL